MPVTPQNLRLLEELDPIGASITLSPGPYTDDRNVAEHSFVVEVDATALEVLRQRAFVGDRVYEFMSLARPGDLLRYLRVRPVDISAGVEHSIGRRYDPLWPMWQREEWGEGCYPLDIFDRIFPWHGEDTSPEERCWVNFRHLSAWGLVTTRLLNWVTAQQGTLRSSSDWITRSEIARMDARTHRRDYLANIERHCAVVNAPDGGGDLPACVHQLVEELITRDTVQSVSAPFSDYRLWHTLCTEQLRRAKQSGHTPEAAFTLSGPDSGLGHVPYEDWGAHVHIPYEGACMADLFIKPGWRHAFPEKDRDDGQLVRIFSSSGYDPAYGSVCHYVLTGKDIGPLLCATRTEVGDGWVLYQSKLPYEPNPSNKPHLLERYKQHGPK